MTKSDVPQVKGIIPANRIVPVLSVLIGLCLMVTAAYADTTPESLTTFGRNLYVSSVTYDPAAFFTGDSGTVAVAVTNGNANQSVSVSHATFGDQDIRLTSKTYDTTSSIGPLQTRVFTFSVVAAGQDDTYYPPFSVSYFGTNTLSQPAVVPVDNTQLSLLVISRPDTFSLGTKETISVQVANPRKNSVKNVILDLSGDGLTLSPSKFFIGNLASGASTIVNFSATPDTESVMTLDLDYNNGDNVHSVTATLPITFSADKKQASPIISNIDVKLEGGVYHVTGDVTNAGLLTANAVTVTSLSPAVPEDPYRSYIIGALKQDDFGSFEVTFTADDVKSVPLQLSYKDKDGNVINGEQQVSLSGTVSSNVKGGGPDFVPVIALIVILALAVAGYWYMKKRKNQ